MSIGSEIVKALDDSQLEDLGRGVVKELLQRGTLRKVIGERLDEDCCDECGEPSIKKGADSN